MYEDDEEPDTTEICPRCKVEEEPVLKEGEGWATWECASCGYIFEEWHAGEDEARRRKVEKISDFIREAGVDPLSLAEMNQDERDGLASRAGQRTPSDKTWQAVIEAAMQKMAA